MWLKMFPMRNYHFEAIDKPASAASAKSTVKPGYKTY